MNLTIVIPAFNSSKTIVEAIISLEKIIFQSKGGLIIVNDASTDDTVSKVLYLKNIKKINIKIINHKENLGGGAARNTAIKIANTKYILMCDSDNIYDSASIRQLYNYITNKNIDGVHPQKSLNFFTSIKKIEYEFDYLKKFF